MQPNQRLGLTMLIATLLVMVAIAYLVFDQKRSERAVREPRLDSVRPVVGGADKGERDNTQCANNERRCRSLKPAGQNRCCRIASSKIVPKPLIKAR